MSAGPEFQVEVYQNEYLPAGACEINAIVTVTATGAARTAAATEVIIVDTSGSMRVPPMKLSAAKAATVAAINTFRDGVAFAIISGTHTAQLVYPRQHGLVPATAQTRAEAKRVVYNLRAEGGTAIGEWLRLADTLLADHPTALRHAILLTDGQNEHETPHELAQKLRDVSGHFVCDCRGVGTNWRVNELRQIADTMLGTVDIVPDPGGLEADFRAMAERAMGKSVADVALRLWTPQHAMVKFVKQVEPTVTDLTARRVDSAPRSGDYPTGSWGEESRDYHICIEVSPAGIGDKMLAGRVSMVMPGTNEVLGTGRILAIWTDDEALSTRINPEVAHYTGQAELAEAIQEGLEARKSGDVERATAKLGRAVALANQSGHTDTSKLLARIVDIDDPVTGTVRLRRAVDAVDEMTLDTRSTATKRVGRRPAES